MIQAHLEGKQHTPEKCGSLGRLKSLLKNLDQEQEVRELMIVSLKISQ